jgi:hypothetical protein
VLTSAARAAEVVTRRRSRAEEQPFVGGATRRRPESAPSTRSNRPARTPGAIRHVDAEGFDRRTERRAAASGWCNRNVPRVSRREPDEVLCVRDEDVPSVLRKEGR